MSLYEIPNGSVDWAKKPGKLAAVKFVKDPNVPRDDVYKSGTVHVPQGLPPNSESRPTPRMRSTQQYPQTSFSRPSYGQPTQQTYAQPQSRPVPSVTRPGQRQPNGPVSAQTPAPPRISQDTRPVPQIQRQPPPPPPPPPPPVQPPPPAQPIYRALYDFAGQSAGELSFKKGEVIDISRKENTGIFVYLFLC
jgi:myosin I